MVLGDTEAVALSHGHWDHTGALTAALDEIARGRKVPCHVNPGMFLERGAQLSNGIIAPFQKIPSLDDLAIHGAELVNNGEARPLLDDFFYLSGEIHASPVSKEAVRTICAGMASAGPGGPIP